MLKKTASLLLFFVFSLGFCQVLELSKFAQISIITSGPGNELYEKFGHTAIRVNDPILKFDEIYNYGIINFSDPNFYIKFAKGYMNYKLDRYPFYYALKSTNEDQRWMKEQILTLTNEQKQELFAFLEKNALPENANYLYDPFLNNCATKPRDIIKKILNSNFLYSEDFITKSKSFRQLMNEKIYWNTWGNFGINLALGSKLDAICTPEEYMYLPDYLFYSLEKSKIETNKNLISETKTLLDYKEIPQSSDAISPFLISFVLFVVGFIITGLNFKNNKRSLWLDFILFLFTGTLGVLLIFLWFFTNHSMTANNLNVLWAFFPNIIVAFFIVKKKPKKWIKKYIIFILILLILIPFVWISRIQQFHMSLLPFLFLLFVRYYFLHLYFKKL